MDFWRQYGIVNGTGNNQFSPYAAITREQMAVMMQNYAKVLGHTIPASNQYPSFTDENKIGPWAKDAVKGIAQAGIMIGKTGGNFDPKANVTKAESAAILRRFVELVVD